MWIDRILFTFSAAQMNLHMNLPEIRIFGYFPAPEFRKAGSHQSAIGPSRSKASATGLCSEKQKKSVRDPTFFVVTVA